MTLPAWILRLLRRPTPKPTPLPEPPQLRPWTPLPQPTAAHRFDAQATKLAHAVADARSERHAPPRTARAVVARSRYGQPPAATATLVSTRPSDYGQVRQAVGVRPAVAPPPPRRYDSAPSEDGLSAALAGVAAAWATASAAPEPPAPAPAPIESGGGGDFGGGGATGDF